MSVFPQPHPSHHFSIPSLQSIPVPRFNPTPIDVPEFQTISDAERFLAKIAVLTARGELDFQSALELTTIAKTWIDARSSSEIEQRLLVIEQSLDSHQRMEGLIPLLAGCRRLPGTDVIMPGQEPDPTSEDTPMSRASWDRRLRALEARPSAQRPLRIIGGLP